MSVAAKHPATPLSPDIQERLAMLASGPRRLLGIVGPPGSGKSTLAAALAEHLGPRAQAVPMDGFHLAQVELERLGRAQRKGAPDTFDAAGYAALLGRLRAQADGEVVYAPDFRRAIEEPVAGALPVFPETPLVITEGNYLLLDEPAWRAAAAHLDEVWYLQVETGLRLERLAQRHQQFGRSRAEALAWIAQTDEPNARRIEACRTRAHRQLVWDTAHGGYALMR
ncbi:nucleoside/nucleotide kinase family protein [Hydrogenophaga crassostreae]|uniref:Nucleoside/nucleotide kinase family protein n=2 Tax=Hydrogenophaga crassostreae TaxID=1763535 RepID=A0A167GYQ0_9BURK|nr:nucleoside/nucleotide kinase family protein [Hydrogenophaga crassostreae]AOW12846.1 nucleoside/nucleotide kinase family protein [Hydrogenophaga crassostreae]OAD40035.1 nucleoside/nucleotide kinase family protein [Hydrogenophaga crassostreae]